MLDLIAWLISILLAMLLEMQDRVWDRLALRDGLHLNALQFKGRTDSSTVRNLSPAL